MAGTGRPLSLYHTCGLASVLNPSRLHYSPVLGLLTWSTTNVVSNLRKFPSTTNGKIAQLLFYQREDKFGRSFGPVGISKSKSNIASWLTPYSIGCLLGLATSPEALVVSSTCVVKQLVVLIC
jgi:hypothetical protein